MPPKARSLTVFAFLLGLAAVWAVLRNSSEATPVSADRAGERSPGGQTPSENEEEPNRQKADPLAPLRADQLPPRTRVPPDPAKHQLVRDAVFVRIGEVILNSKGETILPDRQVVDIYLQEYLRRAGFTIATSTEKARYRLEGDVQSQHYKDLKVQGQTVAYKVRGECSFFVLDREGNELESFRIPEVYQENVRSEESAFLQLRRYVAKLEWDRLRLESKIFGDPQVTRLVNALCVENADADGSSSAGGEPITTEEVISQLADRGLAVVPFMIEALSDTRNVRMRSSYPGLNDASRSELKVYHIADKVLEEIFQKVSRMGLKTTPRERFRIMKGWEQEWRRFCPPFRNSPNAPSSGGRTRNAEASKPPAGRR